MRALLSVLYGLVAHALFFVAFLYAIGFVGNIAVPKSIDTGATAPLTQTVLVIGIYLKERDLVHQFGDQYLRYRKQVGMLMPRFGRKVPEQLGEERSRVS